MLSISVIAQKGGTGKTTLCLATACAAAIDGRSTLVVDLDPQATAASWGDRRDSETPVVLSAQPPRLARVLDAAAAQGVELAVIDTAPRVEQSAVAAAKAADLVLIPCRPAIYDLETVAATIDLVRAVAPATRLLCILNGVPPRGPRQQQARDVLATLGVPVCTASLGLRAAIDYAAAAGMTAQEYDPRSKAANEATAVYAAVRRHRGRDAGCPAPPAQIRTCPLRHPAPPLGGTRRCANGKTLLWPRVSDFHFRPVLLGEPINAGPLEAVLLRSTA